GASPEPAEIPPADPVELLLVGRVERAELALDSLGREEPRLQLVEGLLQRVGEAGPGGGGGEAAQIDAIHDTAHEQRPLCASQEPAGVAAAFHDPGEDVVEGADRTAEERRPEVEQLPLDPVYVRPVGHDEERFALGPGFEGVEIAVEQKPDL